MKKILFVFLLFLLNSCSPSLYINGGIARKFNTSQNRYRPQKPYVGKPSKPRWYSCGRRP